MHSRRAIVLFAAVCLLVLAADLAIKDLSFERVADVPLKLSRNADGEPVILAPSRRGPSPAAAGTPWVEQPRQHPRDPASAIPTHDGKVVVPSVLNMRLTINTGAVFGLGKGARWLLLAASLTAAPVIVLFFLRCPANAHVRHAALALILAGDLGNLYDRVVYNAVRDMFLLFPGVPLPFGLRWPHGSTDLYPWIFNLADSALLVGVIALAVILWRAPQPPRNAPARPG